MKVGVIGAGTMGSGIAQAFAMTDGYEVCLCDIKEEYAEGGKAKIQKNIDFLIGKEKITAEKGAEIMGKITTGLNAICADCDLIIEVALEKLEIKQSIFKELMGIVKKDCIFATNTSSLSITEIGAGLDRAVIGMHFFNPANRMKLVEVIAGLNTPVETVEKIKEILAEQFDVEDISILNENTNIADDLGADSLDVVEVLMSIEDEFKVEIPDEEIENIRTIGQLAAYIENNQ